MQYPEIVIERGGNGGLSDATVSACWERFYKQEEIAAETKE